MSTASPPELPAVCDIVVVGGAMVGGTIALALAQQGFKVVLIESHALAEHDFTTTRIIDRRTTAVAAATASILGAWGVWSDIEPESCAIKTVHVSQRGHFGALRMHAEELEVAALGYVLDNAQYYGLLANKLSAAANLTIAAPAQLIGFSQSATAVTIDVKQAGKEHSLSARLMVAADGAQSAIRSKLGIEVSETDYEQYALTANVESELANKHIAYERFTSSGPLAMLPVSTYISSVIYTIDASQIAQFESINAAHRSRLFLDQVQQQFGHRLGQLKHCSEVAFYPLILRAAKQSYHGRTLLLGNALRTLHPVAGQGFNLAIRDIGKLMEILSDSNAANDPGASEVLKTFATTRAHDQSFTVGATDMLARLFRGENKSLSHLRALGLLGLDSLPPLKRAFARRAMGYGAPLPDLDYHHSWRD